MRLLYLLLPLALLACEQPCALVCENDTECLQQGALPGYYCLNLTVWLQDCYRCAGGSCVDTFHNCGACDHVCAAGQFCSGGVCAGACAAGETKCGEGSCYDLASDRNHCGDCNHACARDENCVNNSCTQTICG